MVSSTTENPYVLDESSTIPLNLGLPWPQHRTKTVDDTLEKIQYLKCLKVKGEDGFSVDVHKRS